MNNKKVSVIVPVYNTEKFLDGCITSILGQDYANIELVLINDGSSDRSGVICEKYAENYPNIIYRYRDNAGVSAARNAGLDIASGDYVVFVDSDDRIKSNMISLMVGALESASADLCICGYDVVRVGGVFPVANSPARVYGQDEVAEYFAVHFSEAVASSVCCKLYKRELICHRFDTNISMGEDLLFNLDYVKRAEAVVAIPETLYIYDKNNDASLTRNYKALNFKQDLYVFKMWLGWFEGFERIDDTRVHYRITELYFRHLFNICSGALPGKKIDLLREMCDDVLDTSARKAFGHYDRLHKIVLWLILRRRYRTVLFIGTAYCNIKRIGF